MEETTAFQDWELLQNPASAAAIAGDPKVSEVTDDISAYSAIKSDYFTVGSDKPLPTGSPSEEEGEGGGADSDNYSWIDPDSDSRYGGRSRGQLNFSGFWSDDSSDGQRSSPDSEKSELGKMGDSPIEGVEAEQEKNGNLGPGDELAKMGDGSDALNEPSPGGGAKGEAVWWKAPLEMIKFYILKARPIWSISIAAALVGVVMLGRRLYKMKYKTRSIPLRIIFDDKKASQFMIHAARLNEAFSVVRRAPVIRPQLPAGSGVTPWPAVSFR